MKLFNPFKPHIAVLWCGGYVVRVLNIAGWAYLERECDYWRSKDYVHVCFYLQPIDAAERCIKYINKPKFSKLYAH